ncbi:hypothetical protein N0V90_002740 [Kalmusia sp. IMI 367209]|nr:hypothetical protein N0V90_002740 [Kalmusia sp. IMI 367209]
MSITIHVSGSAEKHPLLKYNAKISFLQLPGEIRNRVYEYALLSDAADVIEDKTHDPPIWRFYKQGTVRDFDQRKALLRRQRKPNYSILLEVNQLNYFSAERILVEHCSDHPNTDITIEYENYGIRNINVHALPNNLRINSAWAGR